MATLTVETITRAGLAATENSATAAGDEFANTGVEFVRIYNGSGGSITVTIVTSKTIDGLAVADREVSIANGAAEYIGPFDPANYNNSNSRVELTYDDDTSVTVEVLKLTTPG